MPQDKKYMGDARLRLNADDATLALEENDLLNLENARSATTDAGVTGVIESIGSNVLISPALPSVTFITIGTVEDTENGRHIKFQFNTTGTNHKIVALYTNNNTEYNVLLATNVTGGLGFSKDSIIHSANIINGYLYWVDGTNNQPRKVNIEAGIKGNHPTFNTSTVAYTFPLNFTEITLIKPPPTFAPNITKNADGAFLNNFIANESFEFAYQYIYYDNETTVTGHYSVASKLNKPASTLNRIIVTMSLLEVIPNTVRIVNLIVRYSGEINGQQTNNGKIIKQWDKNIVADAAAIAAHNAATTFLVYNFYNNVTGETLAPDDILRPFDLVPIYSQTQEAARNRLFLANNTEGYDTPILTSITPSSTQTTISGSALNKQLISISMGWRSPNHSYSGWYVYLTEVVPIGYYAITSTEVFDASNFNPPPHPAAPTTVAFSGLTFRGADQAALNYNINVAGGSMGGRQVIQGNVQTANPISITAISTTVMDVFKSKSQYRMGVVFYDFAMRKCGVVTNDNANIFLPTRNFAYSTGTTALTWTLSNTNALTEIPTWAYYYSIVRTLNLRTRFFIQGYSKALKYATKDKDGKYVFTSDIFVTGTVAIGIPSGSISQSGLGYSFTEGDICVLTKSDNTTYELPVLAQVDNYIVVSSDSIGTLKNTQFVFEIYTPYQTSDQEPYFEMGQLYRITNPTNLHRQYEVLAGVFNPDSFIISRDYQGTSYFGEAMSPNDAFYKRWDNDSGKPNYITKLGQVVKTQYGSFSDTFIPNTAINGLSSFRFGNQFSLPEDCGAIKRLILTSKVQNEQGTVMLAICTTETASIYMGEVQISDSTGATQFFGQSKGVIGTINILKGTYGTINPESAVEFRGNVFWADANNRKWIQYSVNGLDPISNYKMERFWNLWFKQYNSMTAAEIELLGNRPFIFTAVDPYHKELLISIPKLLNTPPKGYLPDYPSEIYPFDILDYQATTIVYKLEMAGRLPHWQGRFTFYAENFITLSNKLYSFKNGLTYLHNQTNSQNNFYGTTYKSRVMFVSNQLPQVPKVYDNISVDANMQPTLAYFYNNYPYQQSTDLVDYDFNALEGIWCATIRRNKLQPTATGYTSTSLLTGEKMRNVAMMVMLEFTISATALELKFINIGYSFSRGHINQLQK